MMPFFTINNILKSVKRYSFTLILFKAACHGNPGTVSKQAGSSSCISRHILTVLKDFC